MFDKVSVITIDSEYDAQRIDNFLFRLLKGVPKSRIYRLLRAGEIRLNKKRCQPSVRLQTGDILRLPPIRVSEAEAPDEEGEALFWAKQLKTAVLCETPQWIAFNKPYGLAVHGGSGSAIGLIEVVKAHWPNASHWELVHRLDKDTSGCLLVAKKRSVLRVIQEAWRSGEVKKRYLALLEGSFGRNRRIDVPLKRTIRGQERVVTVDLEGKSSVSDFKVLKRYTEATLVEVQIHTGRTHQIRVHAQHMNHAILGDEKYGSAAGSELANKIGLTRLFLHAAQLSFTLDDQEVRIDAPTDANLLKSLSFLQEG